MQLDPRWRTPAHPVLSELWERHCDQRRLTSAVPDVVLRWQRAEQFGLGTLGIIERKLHASLDTICTEFCSGLVTSGTIIYYQISICTFISKVMVIKCPVWLQSDLTHFYHTLQRTKFKLEKNNQKPFQ